MSPPMANLRAVVGVDDAAVIPMRLAAAHLGCRSAETFVVARPHRSARPKPGPLFRHPSRVGHGQEDQMDIRHEAAIA